MPDLAAAPLSVSSLVLRSRQLEIDAVHHLASRAALVDGVGQLIEGLQRERGASGVYLASKAQRFADLRGRIVQEVVLLEAKLRAEFAQHVEPAQGATAKAIASGPASPVTRMSRYARTATKGKDRTTSRLMPRNVDPVSVFTITANVFSVMSMPGK